jgi:hypothetical protein
VLVNILPLKSRIEDDCTYIYQCITSKSIVFVKLCIEGEDSEECNDEYQDNQGSNIGCILIIKLNAEVLGF